MSLASKRKDKLQVLQDRSFMLKKVRQYFYDRGVQEVDCSALNVFPSLDPYIEPIKIFLDDADIRFLHTSPEYGMKKLLSLGMSDIFQLSHVFRKEEEGRLHLTEFMMAEWYRLNIETRDFLQEAVDLIGLFLAEKPYNILSYTEALTRYAKIHEHWEKEEILKFLPQLPHECESWTKEELFHYIWSCLVQPNLGQNEITIITDFPKEEAALSQTHKKLGKEVAKRFEFYIEGLEIANGYHELTDADEHRIRFAKINQKRKALGKEILPVDTTFLHALDSKIPDCHGIAVGFDRLMMLRHHKNHILDVVP
ncbi:MAG: elongation factor P--(R)-beta-lysine ligase [Simkaniaceae bacterium]